MCNVSKLFGHCLDMFRTSLGVKIKVFPNSFVDVWAIIWQHRRCLGRGLRWTPDENAVLRKFISFFELIYTFIVFFTYFSHFPLYIYIYISLLGAPFMAVRYFFQGGCSTPRITCYLACGVLRRTCHLLELRLLYEYSSHNSRNYAN